MGRGLSLEGLVRRDGWIVVLGVGCLTKGPNEERGKGWDRCLEHEPESLECRRSEVSK